MIGVNTETTLAGIVAGLADGFGVGFAAGALTAGAFTVGVLTGGTFVAPATVRVVVTDLAQTVTEVESVFDEWANPLEVAAVQAQVGVGES